MEAAHFHKFPKIGGDRPLSDEMLEHLRALNMHSQGPGRLALGEWEKLGLELPELDAMRAHRLARVRAQLEKSDFAAAILMDPLNIRYAADSTNMQLWVAHNPCRYAVVFASGPLVLYDYVGCEHLSLHNPLVDEVRTAVSWDYFAGGSRCGERAQKWADDLADLLREHGAGGCRVSVDRCGALGRDALERRGFRVVDGMGPMELARAVKCDDEIKAMRCAAAACESGMDRMRERMRPGVTENELWSVFLAENVMRGAEWIETRLLAAGPRTNPWFQECSSYEMAPGDWLSFDTDLVGPYGVCIDMSRTWHPEGRATDAEQDEVYRMAREQVEHNTGLVRAGLTFRELSERSLVYPPEKYERYSVFYHGVGLCDEYPSITFPDLYDEFGYDGALEAGMVITVESYVGRIGGRAGAKMEDQVLVTEGGCEVLTRYSLDL